MTWKTIRVFISSTFRDMQAERDHLVRFVFPKLREELLTHRLHFMEVDLRWGVTSDQDTLETCREIVDQCRPYFLCMLGGRYGWVPSSKSHSITAEEVHYGVLESKSKKDRDYAHFYFRDDAITDTMVESDIGEFRESKGSENQKKLIELKQVIIDAGLNIFTYSAQWDNKSNRLTGLEEFGDHVYDDLLTSIKSDPDFRDRFTTNTVAQLNEFAEENAAMEAFVEECTERFVLGSRVTVLKKLLDHAMSTDGNNYVCLTGAPGSGKSALLAHLSQYSIIHSPSTLLICHFVGASPGSTDVRRTLSRLCHELKVHCQDITADIPSNLEELRIAFPDFLRQACTRRRVVILFDAVNHFDLVSHSAGLHWLPDELPANARIILSAIDGPGLEELRRRPHKPQEIMLQPLTSADREAIIEQFLRRYRKQFEPSQRATLLSKTDSGTPLYLLAALEELRTLGIYEEITRRIAELPPTTPELFGWILERLENDDSFRDAAGQRVGHDLVSRFAALLGASRYGLSQRELADLLEMGDPQGNVAALLHLLRPYLMRRGELLDFYHSQFRAAADVHLHSEVQCRAAHRALANYFRTQADPVNDSTWKGNAKRGLSELPYHQTQGQMWLELEKTLTDISFIEAKCIFGMIDDLVADYQTGLALMGTQVQWPGRQSISEFNTFVKEQAHILSEAPELAFQQAANQPDSLAPAGVAAKCVRSRGWLKWLNKPQLGNTCLMTMSPHSDGVNCCAWSPDGKRLVSGSGGPFHHSVEDLKIWDAVTGAELIAMAGHPSEWVTSCDWSSDGTRILSSGLKTLKVWDAQTGRELQSFTVWDGQWFPDSKSAEREHHVGHFAGVSVCAWSPDGKRAATGASDGTLRIWDTSTGKELAVLQGHTSEKYKREHGYTPSVTSCDWSPDGKYIVSGSGAVDKDLNLIVWDTEKYKKLSRLSSHDWQVQACMWSPDGRYILSGSDDHRVIVWDAQTFKEIKCFLGSQLRFVKTCAWSPDGEYIVAGGRSLGTAILQIWNVETGTEVANLLGHSECVVSCSWSPDGLWIASGSEDKTLKIWDLAASLEDAPKAWHTDKVSSCAWSPDGKRIVSCSADNVLKLWEAETGVQSAILQGHTSVVSTCTWSPDGKRIMSAGWDKVVRVWEADSGIERFALSGHDTWVYTCSWSPDGERIASGSDDHTVRVWDAKTGQALHTLLGHSGNVRACPWSPDGRYLISSSWDGTLNLWDGETWTKLKTLRGHGNRVATCAWSPDGNLVVSGGGDYPSQGKEDNTIKVWDVAQGKIIRTLYEHSDLVTSCVWSPDGQRIISTSKDKTIRVWSLRDGAELASFFAQTSAARAHAWSEISGCAWSPDGRLIISASQDKTLMVRDAVNGAQSAQFIGEGELTTVDIAGGGQGIAAGDNLGMVYIVRLMGVNVGPPIVTAVRLYRFDASDWDTEVSTRCSWCGMRFIPDTQILVAIEGIIKDAGLSPEQSPCLVLPDSAWNEPRLISECPRCGGTLKYNPFIVDALNRSGTSRLLKC